MSKKDEEKFQKWAKDVFLPKLPENLRNSWTAIVENEYEAKPDLMNAFFMQDDYTGKTQKVAKEREELETRQKALEDEKVKWQQWYTEASSKATAVAEREKALIQMLQNTGYVPGQAPQDATPPQDAILKELTSLKQYVARVDKGAYDASVVLPKLAYDAAKENYSFDPVKIVEISTRTGVPLQKAFEEFTAPERQKRAEEVRQKELDEAREAGKREALSTRSSPDATSYRGFAESSAVLDHLFKTPDPTPGAAKPNAVLVDEAIKAFYEAGQTA